MKSGSDEVACYLKDTKDPPAKKRKRIPPVSAGRLERTGERAAVVAEVLARPGPRCEMAQFIPEIARCRSWVTEDRPNPIEVDEIRGGPYRVTEMYDPARCRRGCHAHHDAKTANKREFIRRLEGEQPWGTMHV